MKLRFHGPQAVRIPSLGTVEPGQELEVPAEVARSLVKRPQWKEVKTDTKGKE
jgi:hypothetical protein